ncbi:MAG: hypothetical protein KDA53_04470 [Hyphomonas sp.]|nr:hypothetical protein [Hyphomonas sp.]
MPRLSHLDRNCAALAIASLCLSGCVSVSQTTPKDIAHTLVREALQAVHQGEGGLVVTAGPLKLRIG